VLSHFWSLITQLPAPAPATVAAPLLTSSTTSSSQTSVVTTAPASQVGEEVHGNSELQRFNNVFHEKDRLESEEEVIELGEESLGETGDLISWQGDINIQKLLKGMSVLGLVDGSQHGLVDPEAHGGGDQGEGEVTDHTDEGDVSDGEETDED